MRLIPVAVSLLLSLSTLGPALAEGSAAADSAAARLVADLAAEAGVSSADWSGLVVERHVTSAAGAVTVERASGAAALALVAEQVPEGFERRSGLATDMPPDVVAGAFFHFMIQWGECTGYDDEELASGVRQVEGAWHLGQHVVAGALGEPPGVATYDPTAVASPSVAGDLRGRGVGSIGVSETFITLWGICLGTIGTLEGVGVFTFDMELTV